MHNSAKELIKNINSILESQGWTQKQLANKIGMPEPALSRYLTGKTIPGLDIIDKISTHLNTKPWELIKPEGVKETLDPSLTKVIILWSTLDEDQQRSVLTLAKTLSRGVVSTDDVLNPITKKKKL